MTTNTTLRTITTKQATIIRHSYRYGALADAYRSDVRGDIVAGQMFHRTAEGPFIGGDKNLGFSVEEIMVLVRSDFAFGLVW